jgi:hypothetical protein
MALTPGSYVPQGQVGTGAAYVHQIKDRSGYLEAMAEAAKKQRLEQEKQMAKLKGFDYGKVVDPVMKQHISEQYKNGLTAFSEIVAKGGDISNITTPEGIAFTDWQNNIKNEADTAARAEAMKSQFQTTVANNVDDYDVDIVNAALSSYDNAQTPDQKLKAMVNFNPLYVRGFDYNKWINTQFDKAEKDVEVTDFGGDINKYQEVYNQKIDVLPDVLAVDPGYPIAELQWQRKKDKKEAGFQQENFGQFLTEQIDYQKTLRQNKRESVAAKGNNITINMPGEDASKAVTTPTSNVQGMAINLPDLKEAFEGTSPNNQAFWAAGTGNVPKLVLKGKGNDPAAYGLDATVAEADGDDPNGIKIKGDMLWKFRIPTQGQVFQPQDKSDLSRQFKDANFFDENGKSTGGEPTDMYQDQLGNLWIDLTDKKGGLRHVIVAVGGYTQTYKDSYGNLSVNPLKAVAEKNQAALEKSLGVKFSEFANKYFYNNMNITK